MKKTLYVGTDDKEDDGETASLPAGDWDPPGEVVTSEASEDEDVHGGQAGEGDDAGEEKSDRNGKLKREDWQK